MTGPALAETFKFWDNDTISYYKYLQNSNLYLESTDNKRLEDLRHEFNSKNSHFFPDLTIEEVKNILSFINM